MDYNHYRPHSSLDYVAPAAFAAMCLDQGSGSLHLTQDKERCCERHDNTGTTVVYAIVRGIT